MPSQIDPSRFADGQPVSKAELRAALGAAKAELEHGGFYKATQPGAVERKVGDRLREWLSVKDFGAKGDGGTDDTAAVQAALNAVKGTNTPLVVPDGTYKVGALDATRVRFLDCRGWFASTATAADGYGIKIGTETNANIDLLGGSLRIRIRSFSYSNATLSGVDGIRVQGCASCELDLISQYFDTGVAMRPNDPGDGSSIQYVAFCRFLKIETYGCRTGLLFASVAKGWINENSFFDMTLSPAGNKIAGDTIGVAMEGSYASNNNVFYKPRLEGLSVPIRIYNGICNRFFMTRLESSGDIILGDGGTTARCGLNVLTSLYQQPGQVTPKYRHDCWAPNIVCAEPGAEWSELISVGPENWAIVGTMAYCPPLTSTDGTGAFNIGATIDHSAGTFRLSGSQRAIFTTEVRQGDILAATVDVAALNGSSTCLTVRARDGARAASPPVATGTMPYLGFCNLSSFANGSTGTVAYKDDTKPEFFRLISVNRADVRFVSFELRAGIDYRGMRISKLANSCLASRPAPAPLVPSLKWLDNEATELPDFVGQFGIKRTPRTVYFAAAHNAWVQLS